jgi:hypothetical protein
MYRQKKLRTARLKQLIATKLQAIKYFYKNSHQNKDSCTDSKKLINPGLKKKRV